MSVEQTVQDVFKQVLDVGPEEIKVEEPLSGSLGVDSTELVEISVGLKKALSVELGDGELKKTQSFNDIVEILKGKGSK